LRRATPTGSGVTVTLAVKSLPTQPIELVGVMVYTVVWVAPVTLFGVPLISPLPLFANTVMFAVLSRVHAKVVPVKLFEVVKAIVVIATSEQTVCVAGVATPTGSGVTVTLAVKSLPTQPIELVGVMVYTVVWVVPVTLFGVPLISPLPLFANTVMFAVLSRVHAKVVPVKLFEVVKAIVVIATSEQTVCVAGVATPTGSGVTVTLAVKSLPTQPIELVGVMVYTVVWVVPVTLFGVPLISPLPLFANTVMFAVLSRVHAKVVPVKLFEVVKAIVVIATSEQTVCVAGVATPTGSGVTVTLAVKSLPTQPIELVGVMVYTVVWVVPVTLFGVPLISPLPLFANTVMFAVLSRVHAKVVPVKLLLVVKEIVVIATSEHTVCVAGVATPTGSGVTVTLAVKSLPTQPIELVGVMVYTVVWVVPVTLFGVPLISPLPLFANTVMFAVLSRVHAKVVPVKLLLVVKAIVVIATSEQTVCVAGVATPTGSGVTVTLAVKSLPTQPIELVGVMVYTVVWVVPVTLFGVPLISPLPLFANTVMFAVLSRVHAKVVPVKLFEVVKAIVVIATSEQTVCVAGVATPTGSGVTVTLAVKSLPTQPIELVGVMVYTVVWVVPVTLFGVPLISPLPLFANTVMFAVLSRVHAKVVPVKLFARS
jgi:hypothetical protein